LVISYSWLGYIGLSSPLIASMLILGTITPTSLTVSVLSIWRSE